MKKLIYIAGIITVLAACSSNEDPEVAGQKCLSQARDYLTFGRYDEARAFIDSLRNNHPKALNAREEGILLLDSIDLQEAYKDLEEAKTSLANGTEFKDSIEFNKEEAEQKITFFTKKLTHDKENFKKH